MDEEHEVPDRTIVNCVCVLYWGQTKVPPSNERCDAPPCHSVTNIIELNDAPSFRSSNQSIGCTRHSESTAVVQKTGVRPPRAPIRRWVCVRATFRLHCSFRWIDAPQCGVWIFFRRGVAALVHSSTPFRFFLFCFFISFHFRGALVRRRRFGIGTDAAGVNVRCAGSLRRDSIRDTIRFDTIRYEDNGRTSEW